MRTNHQGVGHQRGLSLIEILVVLAIIALISSGIAVLAIRAWERAQIKTAGIDVAQISSAVEVYRLERGRCPTALADLVADGAIKQLRRDPWGSDYVLTCPGTHDEWDVVSAGKDGELGTDDDITSWVVDPS